MNLNTNTVQQLADTITPVALYLTLRDLYQNPLLLESSDYNTKDGHYSYICLNPLATISLDKAVLRTKIKGEITEEIIGFETVDVLNKLTEFKNLFQYKTLNFPFSYAGLFGYMGFDCITYAEDIVLKPDNKEIDIPELLYGVYGIVLVFHHTTNTLTIISHHFSEEESKQQLTKLEDQIHCMFHSQYNFKTTGETSTNITDEAYRALVSKAKEHCQIGDVFQLVLSRRFSQSFVGDDFNVYRALKNINPSPYLFYFDLGDFKLFGSSPEAQLVIGKGVAEIHPIAGTYRRTGNDDEDLEKAKELLNDPKENAEHNMLVDLARNDLSKYCSNVEVKFLKQTQFYSHVIHLVSKVIGKIKKQFLPFELLFGTFPAGTLSGAPKYKALKLIDKYEPVAREFYGGCIGMISHDDQVNHAIMIRTFLSKNNTLYYQAGAGIVISSNEELELQEINNKVSALQKAIKQAEEFNKLKIT